MVILLILYVLGISIDFCQTQCLREHGPYQMEDVSLEPCKPSNGVKDEMVFEIKRTRFRQDTDGSKGRDWCYTGYVSLPEGFNNSFEAVEEGFCEDSIGMWKKYQTNHLKNICFSWLLHGLPHWANVIRNKRKQDNFCPVPAGNYTISCLMENLTKTQLAKARRNFQDFSRRRRSLYDKDISGTYFYGTYKHVVKYYLNNKRVGCYTFKRKYQRVGIPVDKYPHSLDSPKTFVEMKRHLKSIMDALVLANRRNSLKRTSMYQLPDFFGRYAPPYLFKAFPKVLATYIDMENKDKFPEGAINNCS